MIDEERYLNEEEFDESIGKHLPFSAKRRQVVGHSSRPLSFKRNFMTRQQTIRSIHETIHKE